MAVYGTGNVHMDKAISGKKSKTPMPMPMPPAPKKAPKKPVKKKGK